MTVRRRRDVALLLGAAALGLGRQLGSAETQQGAGGGPALESPDATAAPPGAAPGLLPEAGGATPAAEPPILPRRVITIPATETHPRYVVFAPEGPDIPRPTLLALHGLDDNGPSIAAAIQRQVEARGWTLVAPTMPYSTTWGDPPALAREELRLLPQLAALLDGAAEETGVALQARVMLFGFSRGAQEALRFTLFYPQRVQAVAAFSAGTYTLPVQAVQTRTGGLLPAPFPFGVADVAQLAGCEIDLPALLSVPMLVGAATGDNRDGDVPRAWDPYVGSNRVERAQRFAQTLNGLGGRVQLTSVPGTVHAIMAPMTEQAAAFLDGAAAG